MKPLALVAVVAGLCLAAGAVLWWPRDPGIVPGDAVLTPMGAGHALTVRLENGGGADRLLSVSAQDADNALLPGPLAIPAGATPSLALDGAHAMLDGLRTPEPGRLVPVNLHFERSGEIAVRARVAGAAAMDHGAMREVGGEIPAPRLDLAVRRDGDGWVVRIETGAFALTQDGVDGPHRPGQGHAHLYLDGLKLQRMYTTEARIGALPPGSYRVRVTLNGNDHSALALNGAPLSAVARIEAD